LFAHPQVLLTPHIAGVTHEGKRKMADVLASKILNTFPHAAA
jgi:phosphoglycerate dehydrogenase-like enzyme